MRTALARLLTEKQALLERLEQCSDDGERTDIEARIAKINIALNFLEDAGPGPPV